MKGSLAQHLKSLHESVVKEVQRKYKSPLKATVTHDTINLHDTEMDTMVIVNLRQIERNGGYDIASDFRSSHVTVEQDLKVLVSTLVSLLQESKNKMSGRYASSVPSKYLKQAALKPLPSYPSEDEVDLWLEYAIEAYHKGKADLDDLVDPLVEHYQDIHSVIERLEGSKRDGKVGMSERQLYKWYDNRSRYW